MVMLFLERGLKVRVAHHISGFWIPYRNPDPLKTGSMGAGLLIDPYTEGIPDDRGALRAPGLRGIPSVIRQVKAIAGNISSPTIREPLPPSRGYATSASMAISYSIAALLDKRGSLNILSAGRISHEAEVKAKTGLGDVSAIIMGSYIPFRRSPGAPGVGLVDSILEKNLWKVRVITAPMGVMSTKKLLQNRESLYRTAGMKSLRMLEREPTLEVFLESSRLFSLETGMMNRELDEMMMRASKKLDIIGYFVKKRLLVVVVGSNARETSSTIRKLIGVRRIRIHRLVSKGVDLVAGG